MNIKDSFLITQNVDNLHQDSGIDEKQISELHGNATFARCLDCYKRYELDDLKLEFLRTKEPPVCKECNGLLKTATISFGQAMPEEEMQISQWLLICLQGLLIEIEKAKEVFLGRTAYLAGLTTNAIH